MNPRNFFSNLLQFLRARAPIGGLEVSDAGLRFAHFANKRLYLFAERLAPGTLERGAVRDRDRLLEALVALRRRILGRRARRRAPLNVVVSLSSVPIYSQVFSIPRVKGENMQKAIELNLRMASPADPSENYAGRQVVFEDKNALRVDILAAFVNRATADQLYECLRAAGFLAVAFEWDALAITRALREEAADFDRTATYAALHVGSGGLTFIVIRRGALYFEYFIPWQDIHGAEREIPLSAFRGDIVRGLQQVLNFYRQHWSEQLAGIYVLAGDVTAEVESVVKENFPIPSKTAQLRLDMPISHDWFPALGSALRGVVPRRDDDEVNVLGPDARGEFLRQHIAAFFRFWRTLVPASLLILGVAFFGVYWFLGQTKAALETNAALRLNPDDVRTVEELEKEVAVFNSSVRVIQRVRQELNVKHLVFEKIGRFAAEERITVTKLEFHGFGISAMLGGEGESESRAIAFKKRIEDDPQFQRVNLPLDSVQVRQGSVLFSMDFVVSALIAE